MKLKEEGKVRALGVSIHDRQRVGQLAEDSPLDALSRYSAVHPSAECDISHSRTWLPLLSLQ